VSEQPDGLKVIDAFDLDAEVRELLRPGQPVLDARGRTHHLPRYFYEVPSHQSAKQIRLSRHFGLNEFLLVDLKEAQRLRAYPRYVPCAIRLIAFYLERFREMVGVPVHIAVNGGYRSPAHKLAAGASPHMWGTAVDLYRVGSAVLNAQEAIDKYNAIAEDVAEDLFVMPYGHAIGTADDHMHLDLGYITLVPREMSEDLSTEAPAPRTAIEERRGRDRRERAPRPLPASPPTEPERTS
jgi:hypothetical protein